jgi:hypothetical protein
MFRMGCRGERGMRSFGFGSKRLFIVFFVSFFFCVTTTQCVYYIPTTPLFFFLGRCSGFERFKSIEGKSPPDRSFRKPSPPN